MLAGLIFRALGATVYVVFVFHVVGQGNSPCLEFRAFDLAGMLAVLRRAMFTLFYPLGLIPLVQFYRAFPTLQAALPLGTSAFILAFAITSILL